MARLKRVRPGLDPGIRRVRSGAGFRYVRPSGAPVTPRDRTRIEGLVIPPAWEDVWISAHATGHIQAIGTDAAGRRQYLYHPDWSIGRDEGKFARALALAAALPAARAKVTAALRADGIGRERVLAAAFRLLDDAAPRMGSTRALAGTRGLTTLRRGDATVEGSVITLTFPGKGGRRQRLSMDDADLAAAIGELRRGPDRRRLLAYRRARRRVSLTPGDVNRYIRDVTGDAFSAKTFRTLHGTIVAAQSLAAEGAALERAAPRGRRGRRGGDARSPRSSRRERKRAGERAREGAQVRVRQPHQEAAERRAVRACADALGNTVAVARGSYIDPRIFERFREGRVLDTSISPETAIRRLLDS